MFRRTGILLAAHYVTGHTQESERTMRLLNHHVIVFLFIRIKTKWNVLRFSKPVHKNT